MKNCLYLITFLMVLVSSKLIQAGSPPLADAQKPIKVLLNAIRYEKFDLAAKQLAYRQMATRLLDKHWEKLSTQEQTEAETSLAKLIGARSFSKGHDLFKHLDAVVYTKPVSSGADAICRSTIVVHRDYKKTEMVIDWVLFPSDATWKIVDMIVLGDSTLAGIREEEVEPLINSGGIKAVFEALRKQVAETVKN